MCEIKAGIAVETQSGLTRVSLLVSLRHRLNRCHLRSKLTWDQSRVSAVWSVASLFLHPQEGKQKSVSGGAIMWFIFADFYPPAADVLHLCKDKCIYLCDAAVF